MSPLLLTAVHCTNDFHYIEDVSPLELLPPLTFLAVVSVSDTDEYPKIN